MGDKKRIKKDNFDMSSMQKEINIMTVEPPSVIKYVFGHIPNPKNLKTSPYQKYYNYNQDDKKYFIKCLKEFTHLLLKKVTDGDCYLSYNYHPDYDDSQMYRGVPNSNVYDKITKNDIYNYALDIFTIELTKRGYNPNKQYINENSVYIEVVLKYE